MVNILDSDGASIIRSGDIPGGHARDGHRPEVTAVLDGSLDEAVIGFMQGGYYSDKRYGVAVRRDSGGAVVVNIDSGEMLAFRKSVGPGTLFARLGDQPGTRFIALQDTLGIVAASPGVTSLNRIVDDPFLMRAWEGRPVSRMLRERGGGTLEVVRPLDVEGARLGIIRLGLSTDDVDAVRRGARRQFIILFVASVVSGAFVLFFVMLRQNYALLNAEHDRIVREVRSMEEQQRRSERLTSMGRLAAGVAHEIRNPLNSVSIIAQRLRSEFIPVEDVEEYRSLLSAVGGEIRRISTIIEHFLKYARPPSLKVSDVRLADLAADLAAVTGDDALERGITMHIDVPGDIVCRCDADQLKQALLNLTLNAFDAAPPGGVVRIAAGKVRDHVRLTVADDGPGIPGDVMPRIFDPYFTTRETGTGLGLSEVHRIVSAHGGMITAANGSDGGAEFTIQLPLDGGRT